MRWSGSVLRSAIIAFWVLAPRGAQAEIRSLGRCVAFAQHDDAEGLTLTLENNCKVAATCTVAWLLACSGGKPQPQAQRVLLAPGEHKAVAASAAACGAEGWRLDRVRWRCGPVSATTVAEATYTVDENVPPAAARRSKR